MIRVEIVLKDSWGTSITGKVERTLKAAIVEAVTERAHLSDLEIARIQFLGPKKAS